MMKFAWTRRVEIRQNQDMVFAFAGTIGLPFTVEGRRLRGRLSTTQIKRERITVFPRKEKYEELSLPEGSELCDLGEYSNGEWVGRGRAIQVRNQFYIYG